MKKPESSRDREHAWLERNAEFLRENHAGEWIAVQGDRMVAAGPKLKDVLEKARSEGVSDPLITAVTAKEYQGVMMFRSWR